MRRAHSFLIAAGAISLAVASASAKEAVFVQPHIGTVVPASSVKISPVTIAQPKLSIPGGPTFVITYADPSGTGFNEGAIGDSRRAVVEAVLTYVGNLLDATGNCAVHFETSLTTGTGPLGAAGTYYYQDEGYDNGFAFIHLTTGVDPDSVLVPPTSLPDIVVTMNFGYNWNNTTGPVGPGQFDLYSVLLHEITHGLGVASLVSNASGASEVAGTRSVFDNLLYDISSTNKLFGPAPGMAFSGASLTGGANTIEFRGAQSILTYSDGSTYPRVNTPATFVAGTSMSHWQSPAPTPSSTVMLPSIGMNTERRTFHPFEIGVFRDLGYSINSTRDWSRYD